MMTNNIRFTDPTIDLTKKSSSNPVNTRTPPISGPNS